MPKQTKKQSNFLDNKTKVATLFINTVKKGARKGEELAVVNFYNDEFKKKYGEKVFLNEFGGYEDKPYALKFLNTENNMALFVGKKRGDHVTSFSLRHVTDPNDKAKNKYLLCCQFPKTEYPNTYDVFEVAE